MKSLLDEVGRQAFYPVRSHRLPRELLLAEMEEDVCRRDAEYHSVHGEQCWVGHHQNPLSHLT